jgi:hypothetical protein
VPLRWSSGTFSVEPLSRSPGPANL